MNIVLGATGQIGFMLANNLFKKGRPVRAVVRDETKAQELKKMGIEVFVADYHDKEALIKAFHNGKTAFLLTPENPTAENQLEEVRLVIDNYREAIKASGIQKIVGLSSMGAQHESGTGNLIASYLLEHAFDGLHMEQTFVRPAYYYSNWMGNLELIRTQGILPTFFPLEMKLSMISPIDVAEFLADVMIREAPQERIYEVCGPCDYSSLDIAGIFGKVFNKEVALQQISPDEWKCTLEQAGFSSDGIINFMHMTKAVIDGKTNSDTSGPVHLFMDFQTFLERTV